MMIALAVGLLSGSAVYLILQRGMIRIIFGFVLLSNAINLLLMAAGGTIRRAEPLMSITESSEAADPLPQAFVLTAIVIAFAITVFLLALAAVYPNDDTNDTKENLKDSLHSSDKGSL